MKSVETISLLAWLLILCRVAWAFPTGAGDCPQGQAAVGGSHTSDRATIATGALADNKLQLRINGRILQPGVKLTLQSGVDQTWTLSSTSDVGFRGFLLRLSGGTDEVDTRVALSSVSKDVQEAFTACVVTQGVGGATHTNADPKFSVSGVLRIEETARNLDLDVTVVVINHNRESTYYYSSFTLDFVEAAVASVSQPTNPPIPATDGAETMADDHLLSLVDVEGGCSPGQPCQQCEGDCRMNWDCAGSLECYRRPGEYGIPVPGCKGEGTLGNDYCYEPQTGFLRLRTPHCNATNPCEMCEGDCNNDSDCEGDLKCFHRLFSDTTIVPGCNNLGFQAIPFKKRVQWTGLDYCYNPILAEAAENNDVVGADCDSDDDCFPVACFQEPCMSFVCRDSRCTFIEKCGPNECAVDEFCCNESCGTCTPIGSFCPQAQCEACGAEVCGIGETCCSPDCDICKPAGGFCPDICSKAQAQGNLNTYWQHGDSEEGDSEEGGTTVVDMVFCTLDEDCIAPECSAESCLSYVCRDSLCTFVEACGNAECGTGTYCCNESCSRCEAVGVECPQEQCWQCGEAICVGDETCCGTDCGVCQPPNEPCPEACSTLVVDVDGLVDSGGGSESSDDGDDDGDKEGIVVETCGRAVCGSDEFCCNPSCNLCRPVGGSCPRGECLPCGDEVCNPGDSCCSPDCGICHPPGGSCPSICSMFQGQEMGITRSQLCRTDDDCIAPACAEEPCPNPGYICQNSRCVFAEKCGKKICGSHQYCCNELCSMCISFGEPCPKDECEQCGDEICDYGDTCCHPRCSICRKPGGDCPDACNNPYWFLPEWRETEMAASLEPSSFPTIEGTTEFTPDEPDEPTNLSAVSAAERETCTTDEDCSVLPCFAAQCPQIECRDKKCSLYVPCGENRCDESEICCCGGSCAPRGSGCDQACEPCGSAFCPPGEVCCNESCSICTKPGEGCSAEFCFNDEDEDQVAILDTVLRRSSWTGLRPNPP